jgi:hypothetical protein
MTKQRFEVRSHVNSTFAVYDNETGRLTIDANGRNISTWQTLEGAQDYADLLHRIGGEPVSMTFSERLVQAANEAIAKAEGDPGGDYEDRAQPAVVAVLRVLAEVAPGTPEYAVEFDFAGLVDEIEQGQDR